MALADILKKIESDMHAAVKKIEKDLEKKVLKLEEKYKEMSNNLKEASKKKLELEKGKIKSTKEALLRMRSKNFFLDKKREFLEDTFSKALKELTSISDKEYKSVLKNLFKKVNLKTASILVPKGKKTITNSVLSELKLDYKLSESDKILGGFILSSDKIEVNNSFENILEKILKKELEIEVAKELDLLQA